MEAREYATIEAQIAQAEKLVKKKQATLEDLAIATDAAGLVRADTELAEARSALDLGFLVSFGGHAVSFCGRTRGGRVGTGSRRFVSPS